MCIYMNQNYYTRNIVGQEVQVYNIVDAWRMTPWIAQAVQYLLRAKFKGDALGDYRKACDHIDHERYMVTHEMSYCMWYSDYLYDMGRGPKWDNKIICGKEICFNDICLGWELNDGEKRALEYLLRYANHPYKSYIELNYLNEALKSLDELWKKEADKRLGHAVPENFEESTNERISD